MILSHVTICLHIRRYFLLFKERLIIEQVFVMVRLWYFFNVRLRCGLCMGSSGADPQTHVFIDEIILLSLSGSQMFQLRFDCAVFRL
jgi:hypothetical protein